MPENIDMSHGSRRSDVGRSWAGIAAWTAILEAQLAPRREAVKALREQWDRELSDLGGDPNGRDWSRFRALRREREEDWSDWLAQLIEESETGRFAWGLLGPAEGGAPSDYTPTAVLREVHRESRATRKRLRADLVVLWRDVSYTHIEVKVGDSSLRKTFDTSRLVEERFCRQRRRRSDILLLLPDQQIAWESECRRDERRPDRDPKGLRERIRMRTWEDVARALRGALRARDESILWRAWAYAFCGAIEQRLLGLRFAATADDWVRLQSPVGIKTAESLLAFGGS